MPRRLPDIRNCLLLSPPSPGWTREIRELDTAIKAEEATGKAFRGRGYAIRKNVIDVSVRELAVWLRKDFHTRERFAKVRLSEFFAKKHPSKIIISGAVVEIYSPGFRTRVLNATDVAQINSATKVLRAIRVPRSTVWDRLGNENDWSAIQERYVAARKRLFRTCSPWNAASMTTYGGRDGGLSPGRRDDDGDRHLVLVLNGTLSVGESRSPLETSWISSGRWGKAGFRIVLLTGDHRGTAAKFCAKIGLECTVVKDSDEKAREMAAFDRGRTLAIGNARIDIGTFVNARIRIATLQAEGIHTGILPSVDVVVPDIDDALRMLLDSHILCAAMKI